MPTITRGNWSFRDPGDDITEGDIIVGGNFSQHAPNTVILAGKSITILGGNWVNVLVDAAWTIEGGNWTQISRCSHLHPEWDLPVEIDNCVHVVEIHEVTIDGQLVDTTYERKDTVM